MDKIWDLEDRPRGWGVRGGGVDGRPLGPALGGIYTRSAVGLKKRKLSKRGGPPKSGALGSCPGCPVLSSALFTGHLRDFSQLKVCLH